jgi:hypothetical protein
MPRAAEISNSEAETPWFSAVSPCTKLAKGPITPASDAAPAR